MLCNKPATIAMSRACGSVSS